MTDGLGSQSYNYNQLSQMTSETRTFTGVGTYTLGYDYNLAGELKKITDPTNVTINYNYDSIGQMTGITGENNLFGGVSQYASGLTYRASGGLKSMTYGNNYTLAVSYNARLQGSLFEVAGGLPQSAPAPVMKTQYQYYDDGSLKFADGLAVADSDRAYSYDQAGRLKEAYSGSEALDYVNGTNSGTATGPYRQTYQNDAFGNLTSRVNRYWSHNDSFTGSYTNNRREDAAFHYDADGRLTQDSDLQYSFDAAGRSTLIFSPAMNKSLTQTQDGDGQQVKRATTQAGFSSTTYYLRSTVLGGRIVTELNESGQKQKGYVFAGGQPLARQEYNIVVWQHENPLTGTRGGSYTSGLYAYEVNPDPTGVNVGFNDPYNAPPETELPEPYIPTLMGGNSSCGLNSNCTTCILSGFEADCNDVAHLLDIGAAEFHTPTTVYIRYTSGRTQTFPGYTNLPPGLDLRFTDSRAAIAFAWFDYHMPGDFAGGVNSAILHASQSYGDGGRSPNFLTGPAFFFAPPQNSLKNSVQPQGARATPTPNPCGVAIPTDSNDRAVLGTLLGEASGPGENTWSSNQSGVAAYNHPSGTLTEENVYDEMLQMVGVIDHRLQDWAQNESYQNWQDVVTAKHYDSNTGKAEYDFRGYPGGLNILGSLGSEGSFNCTRARLGVAAIKAFHDSPWNSRFYYWKGIKQLNSRGQMFIRALNGAWRWGNTDFQISQ